MRFYIQVTKYGYKVEQVDESTPLRSQSLSEGSLFEVREFESSKEAIKYTESKKRELFLIQ